MRPSPKAAAPTEKRSQVQASILRAMADLLDEGQPYADLNVARLAGRAGISRTAFYFYFGGKREVLEGLAATVAEELYAEAEVWWTGEGPDADVLRSAIGKIGGIYDEHGSVLRAIVEVSTYDAEVAGYWRGLIGRFVDAAERRMLAEQASGNAPSFPARATAFALVWGVERSFYEQLAQGGTIPREELVEALSSGWLRTVFGRVDAP